MVNCESYSERRSRCHDVYGKHRGEECLNEELTEKRCLSMQRCPRQALEYYGNEVNIKNGAGGVGSGSSSETSRYQKALCASWAESFAYANKELEYGEHVAIHHREARQIVSNDSKLRSQCRQIAMDLAECLRATRKK